MPSMMRYNSARGATSRERPTISAEAFTGGRSDCVPNRMHPPLGRDRECRLRAYRDLAHTFRAAKLAGSVGVRDDSRAAYAQIQAAQAGRVRSLRADISGMNLLP